MKYIQVDVTDWNSVITLFRSAITWLRDTFGPDRDIDHVVCHQANLRIVESVLDRVGIPLERCWINLDRYGNTSSASLPLSLDEANRSGRLKRGDLIAMMAIGAGMAWGSALLRW